MKKPYIGIPLIFVFFSLSAQDVKWQKDIKSNTQDLLSVMVSTIERQILVSGSSISNSPEKISTGEKKSINSYDYHIVKLDQNGNEVWDKYFGGTRHDYLVSSVSTQEGGFLLAGTSFSNRSGDKRENNVGGSDVWLIRLNEDGEELWQKTLGTKNNDEASSVVQSTDMGFFVAGNIVDNVNLFGSKDVFASKLDKDGGLMQTTILGGNGIDEITDMIPTPDGGAVLLVYSDSKKTDNLNNPDNIISQSTSSNAQNQNINQEINSTIKTFVGKSEDSYGGGDYWIVKLDKGANVEWQKTYGGSGDDRPKTIAYTDKGYLVAGESRSQSSGNKKENASKGTDLWLINLDGNGNEIWQKSYSFGNRDVAMSLDVIRKNNKGNFSEDKGFLIGGYTQAEEKVKNDDEKFWLLYLDLEGKEEWRKHIEGKSKKKQERLVSAKLQNDGTYLLAGTSAERLADENWKILKLGDKMLYDLVGIQDIKIYPNPVEDYCYVEIGFELDGEAEIVLVDMTGRQVQKIKTTKSVTKINTANLPQGVYVVTANTGTKIVNAKIIKK